MLLFHKLLDEIDKVKYKNMFIKKMLSFLILSRQEWSLNKIWVKKNHVGHILKQIIFSKKKNVVL